jgi:cytochrome P450
LALRSFGANFSRRIPLPSWIPTRGNRKARAAVRGLNGVVRKIIDRRRHETQPRTDLLSLMLHARDEDGSQMTDEQLLDEVRTFLLAGHETTAITLSWTLFLLANHPHEQARVQAELDAVLAGRLPEVADLAQLPVTGRVVQEAMRLYPPVFMIGRENVAEFELGRYTIPAGTTIFASVPSSTASYSMVALSVSISAITSPDLT